ncbi:hypothetical protein pb186bvf_008644 [Paramecium bursaria]
MEPPLDLSEDDRAAIENKHIVMFEYVGTAFLVYISVCAKGNTYDVALGYFGCLLLFARLTGGHFNPAISLCMALAGAITPKTLMVYIVPQFFGAFSGGGLAYLFLQMKFAPYVEDEPIKQLAASLFGELLGSTIFFVFFLIQFVKETSITQNRLLGLFLIASIFFACREYTITSSSSLLNPAAALSLVFFDCLATGWNQLINLWIFLAGPIVGAFVATIFYSQLYHQVKNK